RGGIRVEGSYYRAAGMKRGPRPVHDIGIWVGAYKPRMLALTGELGDGWLPSWSYLPDGWASYAEMNARIDDAAAAAGRRPEQVRRMLNVMGGSFGPSSDGLLSGPPRVWVEQLLEARHEHRVDGVVLATDDLVTTERFAAGVAPAVREQLAACGRRRPRSAAERHLGLDLVAGRAAPALPQVRAEERDSLGAPVRPAVDRERAAHAPEVEPARPAARSGDRHVR